MNMDSECIFSRYEISPQAFELSKSRENERLHFKLQDFMEEKEAYFDLILVLDVLEYMENPYDLLREIKSKSPYKIIQFPLDISVGSVLNDQIVKYRETYGYIHYFTKSIAFRMLEEMGYEVPDCFYTSEFIPLPWNEIKGNPLLFVKKDSWRNQKGILGALGKPLFFINQDLAERLFGEGRLLILAR